MLDWFRKRQEAKAAAEKAERDEMIRFNSPYCPRCGKSKVDMADGRASYVDNGWHMLKLHCDGCGKISRWVDTGFMGIRYLHSGGKEYQTKESYADLGCQN